MWLLFDVGLGPYGDRPLSRWEQAFLPRRLADDVRDAKLPDGRPLVVAEQQLLPQRQTAEPDERPRHAWPWLALGLALAASILACARRAPRLLGGVGLGFWLLCGAVGLVLLLGWGFTAPRALWAHRNLLLFNPLCLLLLPGGWALLRGHAGSGRFRSLLVAVAALAAVALLPLWLQAMPQRNGPWIALLLPVHAAFAWCRGRRKP